MNSTRYACYDKYPPGKAFVNNRQLLQRAQMMTTFENAKLPPLANARLGAAQQQIQTLKNYEALRAAFVVDSVWNPHTYPVLNIAFMDGTDAQKAWVQTVIDKHLAPLMSRVRFAWDTPLEISHIRVSFRLPHQAWSVIGNQALSIPITEPTMNLGWLDDNETFNGPKYKGTGQVVLHEFGHAIGMIHEHQNPNGNPIVWNKPVVYRELQRTNGWSADMTDHNMFEKYGDYELCEAAKKLPEGVQKRVEMSNYCVGELVNGSKYDVLSIMHYFFPREWILEGPEIPINTAYSEMDAQWIRRYYGGTSGVPPVTPPVPSPVAPEVPSVGPTVVPTPDPATTTTTTPVSPVPDTVNPMPVAIFQRTEFQATIGAILVVAVLYVVWERRLRH